MSTHDDQREQARAMARDFVARGDAFGWFEQLYAGAGGDTSVIPWADQAPNPHLLTWLNKRDTKPTGRALVVGCGLGDDAEELARRGFTVTAFDIAPTAIDWCRRRFPRSRVKYMAADLLAPPAEWSRAFDFVQESYTIQAMGMELRERALRQVSDFVAPRGTLLVVCRARDDDEPLVDLPYPLSRRELDVLRQHGLSERSFEDYLDDEDPPVRRFRASYVR